MSQFTKQDIEALKAIVTRVAHDLSESSENYFVLGVSNFPKNEFATI